MNAQPIRLKHGRNALLMNLYRFRGVRVALIQLFVGADKATNVSRAVEKVATAAKNKAQIVVLPECFNSPYGNDFFPEYAEEIPGDTTSKLQKCAKENAVYLVAGSIPERDGTKLYNTMTCYSPEGELVAKYRKAHLFDIDVPGKIRFQESETLSAGAQPVILDTPSLRIGLGICYDIRFVELGRLYADAGCDLLVFPGAFNMTTGPAHWSIVARAQAVTNQVHVAGCSPARDPNATYVAWGHSLLVDPWGEIKQEAEHEETILYDDIDKSYAEDIRNMIPLRRQRRTDIYDSVVRTPPLVVGADRPWSCS